jgi:hypothetical protein
MQLLRNSGRLSVPSFLDRGQRLLLTNRRYSPPPQPHTHKPESYYKMTTNVAFHTTSNLLIMIYSAGTSSHVLRITSGHPFVTCSQRTPKKPLTRSVNKFQGTRVLGWGKNYNFTSLTSNRYSIMNVGNKVIYCIETPKVC